jgi:DNA-directed RNA polymerase specialized sigma24 family protein
MKQLSATTRAVFHLRATESLSFREIGAAIGVSEEAARWHMHEARRRLVKHVRRSE